MIEAYAGQLHSADDLIATVEQYGFLPFFRNEIPGFSVEELWLKILWHTGKNKPPNIVTNNTNSSLAN